MDLDDPLLRSGYENCIRYMIRDLSVTVEELKACGPAGSCAGAGAVRRAPTSRAAWTRRAGSLSWTLLLIKGPPEWNLDSLPTHRCSLNQADEERYLSFSAPGPRIPHALHSRLHDVPWLRSLRPEPEADLALEDAGRLGIKKGDAIELFTGGSPSG